MKPIIERQGTNEVEVMIPSFALHCIPLHPFHSVAFTHNGDPPIITRICQGPGVANPSPSRALRQAFAILVEFNPSDATGATVRALLARTGFETCPRPGGFRVRAPI
jgi:hypothetical protein